MSTLLHGELYITINEARDLPDVDTAFFNIAAKDYSDPYVLVDFGPCRIATSSIVENDLSPKWMEHFRVPVCHYADSIIFRVKDKDYFGEGDLGYACVRTESLFAGEPITGWFDLISSSGDPKGEINIELNYKTREELEKSLEVPFCYFPMRENCKVTLYQDAHCPLLPVFQHVPSHTGNVYIPPCAWRDVHQAISDARHFIYITGWSVFTEIPLLREEDDEKITIGELIKQKDEEGVKVLMLVWNEKLSTELTPGLMGTHDEDTRCYFEGTGVQVVLVPRSKPSRGAGGFLLDQFIQTCYTHHQKSIIMDAPSEDDDGRSRIVAFVGGLDLTDGRWDTPEHNLFRTLTTHHQGDFYNGCVQTTAEEGPRQPWHDIHCRLEGRVARDVLQNFMERWRKQAAGLEDQLCDINPDTFNFSSIPAVDEKETWNVQLFRSINTDSAVFDDQLTRLIVRKGKRVDDSIHRAYVHHIRRAQSYIYIENQYFLGSAHVWSDETKTKAHHLLPAEIVEKIVKTINKGQHFAAYIVIPMFPEGDPTSSAVQEILHWQRKTMEMMYKKIAEAIQANGLDTHPSDYLSFYCLGKREGPEEVPEDLSPPTPGTVAEMLRQKLRFLIYVHSKMMIIDDEYIIVGSANVNQRSMGGNRDTEIAMGAHQPHYTMESIGGIPRASVYAFRKALWAEHLGRQEDVFWYPGSIQCMRKVNEMALENWETFANEETQHMDGHLLKYPLHIGQDGSVSTLSGCDKFPDTEADILGSNSNFLPNKLTT